MLEEQVNQLLAQKFHCSQIMMRLGMDALALEEPNLVKVMTGLAGGLGGCGRNCGALTGGVCMFSLFAGRGDAAESSHPELEEMVSEYLSWFEESYGSPNCDDILMGDKGNIPRTCPDLILSAGQKAMEILEDHGFLPVG